MALKLNGAQDSFVLDGKTFPRFREFYGQGVSQIPKLVESGRSSVSVARLMQRRIEVRNAPEEVKDAWMNNYFFSVDGAMYHPDGRLKIDFDSRQLMGINSKSQISGGALVLTNDIYQALEAEEFTGKQLEGQINQPLTKEKAKSHPVWRALARGDQALLNDFVDYTFAEGKQTFGYDTAMGIYLSAAQGNAPEERAWCVDRLGSGSGADGGGSLGCDVGRFVGEAPEAQIAQNSPQRVRRYTMAAVQRAEAQLADLKRVVRAESLESITSLVGSL